jgi:large subunit ribosomal protein L23
MPPKNNMAILKSFKKEKSKEQAGKGEGPKKMSAKQDAGGTAKKGPKAPAAQSMKDLYGAGITAPSAKSGGETAKAAKAKKAKRFAYWVLAKPLVTEKVTEIGSMNKYGFEVDAKANKIEIANAIEEVYGIRPVKINIVKLKGKQVAYGKTRGRRKNSKKAYVTLPAGKSISIYEGV